jgi:hypothetical protein
MDTTAIRELLIGGILRVGLCSYGHGLSLVFGV